MIRKLWRALDERQRTDGGVIADFGFARRLVDAIGSIVRSTLRRLVSATGRDILGAKGHFIAIGRCDPSGRSIAGA